MGAFSYRLSAVALLIALGLTGCGKSLSSQIQTKPGSAQLRPVNAQGAAGLYTKNTTRLGGSNPVIDAAAVARTVYPGLTPASRPQAVLLVDNRSWGAALAASALAGAPLRAPLLYSEGSALSEVTSQALEAMRPSGASSLGGAQVIRIGAFEPALNGYRTRDVLLSTTDPAAAAAAIEPLFVLAHGGASPHQVIVVISNAPAALQMPAAGLSAESGAPILFVGAHTVPAATAAVLSGLHHPAIYVVGSSPTDSHALTALARFGQVTPITSTSNLVENAIAVARFSNGSFGWGVHEGGHGLAFADALRPLDAPAAAPLSANGDYAPLLLLENTSVVTPALAHYLSNIQPGYTQAIPPVRSVYNHGWLIGDAIPAVTQAEIDSMLEISPRIGGQEEPQIPLNEQ
jgi:hypothetical protein